MIQGNVLYNQLHIPPSNPNLDVNDAIHMLLSLGAIITEAWVFSRADLVPKLNKMLLLEF